MSNISLQNLYIEKDSLEKNLSIIEKKLAVVNLMIDAYSDTENEVLLVDTTFQFESRLSNNKKLPFDNFPYHEKWLTQILYLLDKKNRFLSNQEFAELLLPYYEEFNVDKLKRKVSVNISAAYKKESVKGLIKMRINNLPKGNVWGYNKWLDNMGKIKQEHRPYGMSESGQMTFI